MRKTESATYELRLLSQAAFLSTACLANLVTAANTTVRPVAEQLIRHR